MVLKIVTNEVYESKRQSFTNKDLLELLKPFADLYNQKQGVEQPLTNADINLLGELSRSVSTFWFGEDITENQANNMIKWFKDDNGEARRFDGKKDVVLDFIKKISALKIPAGYPEATKIPQSKRTSLRFYMGSDEKEGLHNVVIVPIYNYPIEKPTIFKEKDWLGNYGNIFFALVGSISTSGNLELSISNNISDCANLIKYRVSTEKYVVVHDIESFQKFINDNQNTDYAAVSIEFAKTQQKDGHITLVIRYRDIKGNAVFRNPTVPTIGLSFDEGSLIPPPPYSGDDDHPNLPDTSFPLP